MKTIFLTYFYQFLHPFLFQDYLEGIRQNNIDPKFDHWYQAGVRPITLGESTLMSWPFMMIKYFYVLLALLIGILITNPLAPASQMSQWTSQFSGRVTIYAAIISVIFFPIITLFYTRLWKLIIDFFVDLYNMPEDKKSMSDDVVQVSLSSNFLYIFPLVGDILKNLLMTFYIFVGLKRRMGMTALQAFFVVMAPLIVVSICLIELGIFAILSFSSF